MLVLGFGNGIQSLSQLGHQLLMSPVDGAQYVEQAVQPIS